MSYRLTKPVSSTWLAQQLALPHEGPEKEIRSVASLTEAGAGDLAFTVGDTLDRHVLEATVFRKPVMAGGSPGGILTSKPRLAFVKALSILNAEVGFVRDLREPVIDRSASIARSAVLEPNVTVGSRSVVDHGVVLRQGTIVGQDCFIRANTVVGGEGFGFERDDQGRPVRFLHLGGVVIEDEVEIGSLTTVVRGVLGDTRIGSGSKVDDHIHIAHNAILGEDCMITACAEISGSVRLGKRVWMGPCSAIIDRVSIGDDVIIGIGAIVVKSVPAGLTITGNPGEDINVFKMKRAALSRLIDGH